MNHTLATDAHNEFVLNTQRHLQHLSTALAVLALTALACNPTPGEGLFTADSFVYGTCQERDILPWEPGFFTVEQFDNTTTIRLQDVGGAITAQVDGIFRSRHKMDCGKSRPLGDA